VDPLAVNEIQNIIRELKKKNIGILITDHNVRETLGIVDRAYILNNGEILLSGEPDEIIDSEIARKFYLGSEFKM
jgi:lipopolysaccharide export system ATP-binding protein